MNTILSTLAKGLFNVVKTLVIWIVKLMIAVLKVVIFVWIISVAQEVFEKFVDNRIEQKLNTK